MGIRVGIRYVVEVGIVRERIAVERLADVLEYRRRNAVK